jgi:hypothetical protein
MQIQPGRTVPLNPGAEMKHCSEERERLARRREQQELEQAREQLATRFEREQREKNGLARPPPSHRLQDEMVGSDDWGQGDKGTSVFSLLFCSKLVLFPEVKLIC